MDFLLSLVFNVSYFVYYSFIHSFLILLRPSPVCVYIVSHEYSGFVHFVFVSGPDSIVILPS